ncbi:hypothetical protein CR164_00375 [Prosthecochloris marina]|uniref:Uncharacterized protein n=1 Tax=Prosthecochloris marina TaxID=2017681 RepID=A0A317T8L4_9CHLB|nr:MULTISPECIES: hypothetical protein [Prosthecochloris]PWW83053.1 hypothetical protein CR164_00375 [Prosthecochloris marina]
MISERVLHRGIFDEIQYELEKKGVSLKKGAIIMRVRRKNDPLVLGIYSDLRERRARDFEKAVMKYNRSLEVTEQLEKKMQGKKTA